MSRGGLRSEGVREPEGSSSVLLDGDPRELAVLLCVIDELATFDRHDSPLRESPSWSSSASWVRICSLLDRHQRFETTHTLSQGSAHC
jgi:hypothetical protein